MFDLIYYNERGEVKSIEMIYNADKSRFQATPQENYFIKGFTIKGRYLTAYEIQRLLKSDLKPLENHFLTARYGFYPELTGYMFRNENEMYIIPESEELISLYKGK